MSPKEILPVVAGYLIGSLSFAVLLVRWKTGKDIRSEGSGNAGATNVLRAHGKVLGLTVALLDIAMPGMTGPDLQQELMLRRQEIPIVFITAHRDETVRPRVLEQGAVECLFKPFSDTALLAAVNAALQVN